MIAEGVPSESAFLCVVYDLPDFSEAKKGKVSEYEYQLEYSQYRFFVRNAPSLAEKVRDKKFWGVIKDGGWLAAEQTAQLAAGKIAGRGGDYVGTRIGSKVSDVGMKLAGKGYTTSGRIIARGGLRMVWEGGNIADASVNLAWEATNALTSGGNKISPRTLKAMQDGVVSF